MASPGASSSDADCAVVVYTDDPPPSSFLRESTIADSAGCGVYRGWSGAEVDFVAGNTFSGLAGCEQSNVPTENNDCSNGACQ